MAAAERLAAEGIEADVFDPRTLLPLDIEPIAASVRRTGRAVVAHEAVRFGGFGAELAAQLQAEAFDCLHAPIQRVGAPFMPVPLSPTLEDAYRPGSDDVYAAAPRGARLGQARIEPALRTTSGSAAGFASAIRDPPGTLSSTSRCAITISRLVSASRACSRAIASARALWRRSIASISAQ